MNQMQPPPQAFPDWLQQVLPQYERLAETVELLLTSILKKKKIEYLSIEGRPKTLVSAVEKAKRKGYSKPRDQMTDLAGIRVVTFLEEQVRQVVAAIEELFEIDRENSMDRAQSLGHDRMGYRSTHFVCVLGKKRNELPEYEALGELKFEIQLRTVLQHAWAELAHDRSFKFKTVLPTHLQRKLNLYSGMLEIVDNGFDEIAKDIDSYQASISATPVEQLVHEEINSISIGKYLDGVAERYNLNVRASGGEALSRAIEELRLFGVNNLGDLEKLIDPELMSYEASLESDTDAGILRHAMVYADIDRYLAFWTPERWSAIDTKTVDVLSKKYEREKVLDLLKAKKIDIMNYLH